MPQVSDPPLTHALARSASETPVITRPLPNAFQRDLMEACQKRRAQSESLITPNSKPMQSLETDRIITELLHDERAHLNNLSALIELYSDPTLSKRLTGEFSQLANQLAELKRVRVLVRGLLEQLTAARNSPAAFCQVFTDQLFFVQMPKHCANVVAAAPWWNTFLSCRSNKRHVRAKWEEALIAKCPQLHATDFNPCLPIAQRMARYALYLKALTDLDKSATYYQNALTAAREATQMFNDTLGAD